MEKDKLLEDSAIDICIQKIAQEITEKMIEYEKNKNNEIKSHLENEELVPEDLWDNFNSFSKKYCGNPNHILYIDKTADYPTLQESINAIKHANGLVFLPHLFIHKWSDDIEALIDNILENYDIDGIECYHSEFNEENIEYLKKLCKERKYLMSGGSDYHGTNKKGIELAVGKGNLKIEKKIIQDWI